MSSTNDRGLTARTNAAAETFRRFLSGVAGIVVPAARAVWRVIGPFVKIVTPLGWLVIVAAVICLVLSIVFGWQEFTFVATVFFAALLVSAFFLVGRARYGVHIELNPRRVVVGDRAMGRMLVTNDGTRKLPPNRMELPVGKGLAEFQLPAMAANQEHEELFAVPTTRRAVIVAGPAVSVRGDHLGLLRREQVWAEPVELFVHPRTVALQPSAAGLVRDLEGQTSTRITANDIAFHALRPYVPGDDRRNVHWRTSARIGQLMVRQFQETRRSQLTMVHVTRGDLYASDEEFELAVSVTASIASRVIADETQMNVVSESGVWRTPTVTAMLDSSSRVEAAPVTQFSTLREFVRERTKRLPAPSVVMIIGGSGMTVADLRSMQSLFRTDAHQVGIRIDAGADPKISSVAGLSLMTVGDLKDLPSLVRGVIA